jgi:hypothetical protein
MGVGTFAFAVDLDQLRAVFGSKDLELISSIESKYNKYIAEYEGHFAEGEPWIRDALKDIVAGKIQRPERAMFYVWATELLCHHLGRELELGDVGWLDDLEIGTGLEDSGPPLPIPRHKDTPLLGFLTAEEVVEQYERLMNEDLSHEDDDVEEARETVLSWLREAADQRKALVTLTQG